MSRLALRLTTLAVAALVAVVPLSIKPAMAVEATYAGTVDARGAKWREHAFDVTQNGTITAVLDWSVTTANLSLFLYRRNPDGTWTLIASSVTKARPETITFQSGSVARWKVGVKAVSGATAYTVAVTHSDGAPPPPPPPGISAIDVAQAAGIAQVTKSYGTYVHDIEGDGDQDFLYNRHGGLAMLLYVNNGDGTFRSVPATFPINDRHDCIWGRIDGDGRPDFYCSVGASGGNNVKENELWLQDENLKFTKVPLAGGATDPFGRGREPAVFDMNGDGLLDIFVGNYFPRPDGQPTPNRFYFHAAPTSFLAAPEVGVDLEIGGQCAEPTDVDDDGDLDLAVCAHGSGGLRVYRNDGGTAFVDVAASLGITGMWCDASWVDLNGDGREDLTLMNNGAFRVMLANVDGSFRTAYSMDMKNAGCRFGGGGNRVAAGDINRDGHLDLYVLYSGYTDGAYNLPDVMLVNDGTGANYTRASMPQATTGSGFSVAPIQRDADPEVEFLVTNGRGTFTGPIQLIDFTPR
jgi:hypothetical protein